MISRKPKSECTLRWQRELDRIKKAPAFAARYKLHNEKTKEQHKKRYMKDKSFREKYAKLSSDWRKRNQDYDRIRKTVDAWRKDGEFLSKRRKWYKDWYDSLSAKKKKTHLKRMNKLSRAWYLRQRDDPEIGWAFKIINNNSKGISAEERERARSFYKKKMKERKDAKRAKQLEERLKGCTEHQRKKVLSKLKEIKRKNVRK